MTNYPDLSQYGYEIISLLGQNNLGGRNTYLAVHTTTKQQVVIKQFTFLENGSWDEYRAYEQEIQVLKSLNHPGIPRYLNSFETTHGFALVQEYIDARPASENRVFSAPEIQEIALNLLKILGYLQNSSVSVIHRDIKPENILIDENLNTYLVDFGFARMGGGEVNASSVVKGTMGFMPPEQLFNKPLTKAADLYGLGASLICLLTGVKSSEIGNLIDADYRIHFRNLIPPQDRGWLSWLEKMVAPQPVNRYQDAASALNALKELNVQILPKVRIPVNKISLTAHELGEVLQKTINISNPIPSTVLTGSWEVAPHPHDPPHTPYDHAWISVQPQKFEGNNIDCQITVDTSKLCADKSYQRQIILRTNSDPETDEIEIEVKTANLPQIQKNQVLSLRFVARLGVMLLFSLLGSSIGSLATFGSSGHRSGMGFISFAMNGLYTPYSWLILLIIVAILMAYNKMCDANKSAFMATTQVVLGMSSGAIVPGFILWILDEVWSLNVINFMSLYSLIFSIFIGSLISILIRPNYLLLSGLILLYLIVILGFFMTLVGGTRVLEMIITGLLTSLVLNYLIIWMGTKFFNFILSPRITEITQRGYYKKDAIKIVLLTANFSISLGIALALFYRWGNQWGFKMEWVETAETLAIFGSTIAFLSINFITLWDLILNKPKRLIKKYKKAEPSLIKP